MNTTYLASTTLPPGSVTQTPGYEVLLLDLCNVTCNVTGNATNATAPVEYEAPYELWQAIIIIILLGLLTCGTIGGNILVCTAVGIVRKLQTPSNLLIVSLAVSDLLVSALVMPLAIMYEVMGRWVLGQTVCNAWTSLDVMLCTASILNLCMISVDRYFVITRPFQYAMKRTPKRMALMVTGVWLASALISIPPVFGWKSPAQEGHCMVSQAVGYQFYATIGAFYIPLTVMIVIYYRIYMVSARIAEKEAKSQPLDGAHHHLRPNSRKQSKEENHNCNGSTDKNKDDSVMLPQKKTRFKLFRSSRLNRISSSKDRKATKTLGVIMGAFTACWLPFFILALIKPFCEDSTIPHWLTSLLLFLGYANSFLNPVIYARFNRDFRTPFKEILMCRCVNINARLRSESYAEQYGAGGSHALRDCIRPPVDTAVSYHTQGQTISN